MGAKSKMASQDQHVNMREHRKHRSRRAARVRQPPNRLPRNSHIGSSIIKPCSGPKVKTLQEESHCCVSCWSLEHLALLIVLLDDASVRGGRGRGRLNSKSQPVAAMRKKAVEAVLETAVVSRATRAMVEGDDCCDWRVEGRIGIGGPPWMSEMGGND